MRAQVCASVRACAVVRVLRYKGHTRPCQPHNTMADPGETYTKEQYDALVQQLREHEARALAWASASKAGDRYGLAPHAMHPSSKAFAVLLSRAHSCRNVGRASKAVKMSSAAVSERIVQAVQSSEKLSQTSKTQYIRAMEIIATLGGYADTWTAIIQHDDSIAALKVKYSGKPSSILLYSTSALSSFIYLPELKQIAPAAFEAWTLLSSQQNKVLAERALSGQLTTRQAPGWVPFDEIIRMRDTLPVGSRARLLLCMYTLIPSLRNDFVNLKIYSSTPPEGVKGNYIILPVEGTASMTITEFKTSKTFGEIKQDLPAALVTEIRESLRRRPRDMLFVSPRTGLPYTAENSFSNWANAILKRTFGKPLTLTVIRHSYISSLDFNNMTPRERTNIAAKMGHSLAAQTQYRFVSRE